MTPAAHQPPHAPSQHAPELRSAARRLGRRRFLTVTGAAAALAFTTNLPAAGVASAAELDASKITDDPF
ncbi:alkaline phosphatase, partial [Streptomyces sp. NPDC008313]